MLWQNNGDNTIIVLEIKVNNSIIQTKEDKMTSINFKNEFGSYTIEINKDGMTIDEVFEDLITPVLLAAGY